MADVAIIEKPHVLHRGPNDCPMCGGPTAYPGVMCAWCSDRAVRHEMKINRLMQDGHTYHCAARQTWGDGCCECERERRTMLTFKQLQDEQRAWVTHNFPGREPFYPLLGAVEELGELAHAHLKGLHGIRGTPEEHHAAKVDAVADVIIFLSDYATANNIDLQAAVEETWARVKLRDWRADPAHGGEAGK